MSSRTIGIVFLGLAVFAIGLGWYFYNQRTEMLSVIPITPTPIVNTPSVEAPEPLTMRVVNLADIEGVDPKFRLTVEIPMQWQAIAVPESKAIAIYDPAASGTSSLEQSQIFLRYFEANEFLTLTTVDVLERTELMVGDRTAVRYRIHKKVAVADFANQPSWRNAEHEVTDIREGSSNPSVFYVIARNPAMPEETFSKFLDSLIFNTDALSISKIAEPVEGFVSRVTLKPFGILINEATSPVQPERFSGYHAAADAEFTAEADREREIVVRAVLDGEVVVSRTATGYGGVMAIKHELDGKQVFGIYGHLKPSSMKSVGTKVSRGEQIAMLGAGGTSETDGERKHLHFGIFTGITANIAGYVSTKTALDNWLDPLPLFLP